MVPEGWEVKKLDKVLKLSSGDSRPTNTSKLPSGGAFPVYGGNGILGFSSQKNHEGKVIIIGRVGEYCGVTRLVKESCWITDNALYAREFYDANDLQFTTYHLQNFDLSKLRSKGGQPLVSQGPIHALKLEFPPLPEQRKIAAILSTWDSAIDKTEALLANARTQKRALMQQLLTGKRRFPEFEGREWREVSFDSVFERVSRKNGVCNENILTISGKDGLISQRAYFNKRVAANDTSGYTLLMGGDFAYNKSYSAGYPLGAIKMLPMDKSGIVSSLYLCFSILNNSKHDHSFYRHYFEAGCFSREIYKIAQEGARNHGLLNVSSTDFFKSKLTIPEIDEQRKISAAIDVSEAEVILAMQQLDALRSEKKALMQQLLTGKKRVVI